MEYRKGFDTVQTNTKQKEGIAAAMSFLFANFPGSKYSTSGFFPKWGREESREMPPPFRGDCNRQPLMVLASLPLLNTERGAHGGCPG